MNKNALKKFAMEARERLIEQVTLRADYYGLTEKLFKEGKIAPSETYTPPGSGELLTAGERAQRDALHARMKARGYDQAIEEGAYTWFNRFIALKYMQEKGRLPVSCRALPSERLSDGTLAPPELVYRALEEERLEGIDAERVLGYLENSQTEALYKYLLIALCNQLSEKLPRMFEPINDYTELLFPDRILGEESVLGLLAEAPADSWEDIQVIGWLYQYYNTALKDETFELLKKNVKITKERVGAATQLFTPEWIVRYMVENSLGRLYIEGLLKGRTFESEKHRIAEEKRLSGELGWAYYLPEAEQTAEVRARLQQIERETNPEKYTVLDPCMGSGHILVYAFDALMTMYRRAGYTDREAVQSILERNLYGLDIDERAAQLAYFALMMRACDYDARFIRRAGPTPQPHVQAIYEAEQAPDADWSPAQRRAAQALTEAFADAREYGSILRVDEATLRAAQSCAFSGESAAGKEMRDMAAQAVILAGQYDAVITNPPYMGSSGMNEKLSRFVKERYPDSKSDLFAVFMERCGELLHADGEQAMITQHAWMFLSSFERLRAKLLQSDTIVSMAHLGARAFEEIAGEVVQTTAFVLSREHVAGEAGRYARLIEPTTQEGKEQMFLSGRNRYTAQQDNFRKIPGSPVAYWVGERVLETFQNPTLSTLANPRQGLATGENDRFTRMWYEVETSRLCLNAHNRNEAQASHARWFPYNKGGDFRKWYGNNDCVVNWENDGDAIRHFYDEKRKLRSRPQNMDTYFRESITWSKISSGVMAFRYKPYGHIYDVAGTSIFAEHDTLLYLFGFCNSCIAMTVAKILSPTINYEVGHIANFPVKLDESRAKDVRSVVAESINISRQDWDSFETSWDFRKHPMI